MGVCQALESRQAEVASERDDLKQQNEELQQGTHTYKHTTANELV